MVYRYVTMLVIVVAAIGAWWLWGRKDASWAAYDRFERSVELHDAGAVYAMVLDIEKTKHGVTEETVRKALDYMFYRHAPDVRRRRFLVPDGEVADRWHRWCPLWEDARTGRSLPSHHRSGTVLTSVDLFRMRNGRWKLCYKRLVGSYMMANFTSPSLEALAPSANEKEKERILKEHHRVLQELGADWDEAAITNPPMTRVAGRMILLAAPGEETAKP